jgi:hypothetical protein
VEQEGQLRFARLRLAACLSLFMIVFVKPRGRISPTQQHSRWWAGQWMKRATICRGKEECEHVLDRHRRLTKLEEQADCFQVLHAGAVYRDLRAQRKVG